MARPIAEAILGRPFSSTLQSQRRVLLVYVDSDLAYPMYAELLRPANGSVARDIQVRAVPYSAFVAGPQRLSADSIYVQAPYDVDRAVLGQAVGLLRRTNPDSVIAFFDWSASCDLRFAEHIADDVDYYVKKSVLKDRQWYLREDTGHSLLVDYYSNRFGLASAPRDWIVPAKILDKIRLGPAFHLSENLHHLFAGKASPAESPHRPIDLQCRIQTNGLSWYAMMRQEADRIARELSGDITISGQQLVSYREYMAELAGSKLCFSPFGYGEICWRDYEAIAAGSVLVKPDMSHLEVDPDIFRPYETYVPVRWDLSDLHDTIRTLLADAELRTRIAGRAFEVLSSRMEGAAAGLVQGLARP